MYHLKHHPVFANIESKKLSGDNINSLINVITLNSGVHKFFGSLNIWFEAIPVYVLILCAEIHSLFQDKLNAYKIRKSPEHMLRGMCQGPSGVAYTMSLFIGVVDNGAEILPDSRYLTFHAAVAKITVIHMSDGRVPGKHTPGL
jgi:hypothetical protein